MDIKRKKKRSCLKWSLALNTVFLILFVCLMRPYFETNDDNGMRMTVAGAGGFYDSHLIFVNILLGNLIVFMETCIPLGNWYTIVQLGIVFVSLCTVTYVFIKRAGRNGVWIAALLLFFFGYEGYTALQFTKTAGLTATAGMMLFTCVVSDGWKKRNITLYVIAVALVTLGSMIRFNMALVSIAFFTGILLVEDMKSKIAKRQNICKKLLQKGVLLSVMLVVVFGCRAYDRRCYVSDEGWREYMEFNNLRGTLTDYGFPNYDENKALYEKIGWTKENLNYYCTWNFADPDKFHTKVLKTLVEAKQEDHIKMSVIKDFFIVFAKRCMTYVPYYVWTLFLMIYILSGDGGFDEVIFYTVGAALLFNFYLFCEGRYFIHRVDIAFLFMLVCCMFFYWRPVLFKRSAIVLGMGVLLLINTITYESRSIEAERVEEARHLIETLAEDEKHLYVAPTFSLRSDIAYQACDSVPFGVMQNMFSLGGWKTGSPLNDTILENHGVKNIYADIVNNDRIYLLSYHSYPGSTLAYIQRNYAPGAYLTVEEIIGPYYIFAVREER